MTTSKVDWHGQTVTIEYSGDTNPLDFALKQLVQLNIKQSELLFKIDKLEKIVSLLTTQQDKVTNYDSAFKEVVSNANKLLTILSKIKPLDIFDMKPGKKFTEPNVPLYEICIMERPNPKVPGKKITEVVDIDGLLKSPFVKK